MKCDYEMITHWLNNQLTVAERQQFEQHLSTCAACGQEVAIATKMMDVMEGTIIPEPSGNMQYRFQGMLDTYRESVEGKKYSWKAIIGNVYRSLIYRPALQLAYSAILVVVGITIGYLLLHGNAKNNNRQELATLTSQVAEMKQMMTLALLENPSASERLRAVSYTEEIGHANQQVIDALLTTLNEDPNVNVRLVTLEALSRYGYNPAVREGLVQSIARQESPLVQLALADVMTKLHEKKAIESFRTLLREKEIDSPVRNRINQTIQKLTL